MMNDLNKMLFTGIVVQDVQLRYTPDGTKTANIRVAIHRRYKNKAQELKEETEFVTVIVWKILADNCAKYLKKGSRVFIEGRLKTREYVDKEQQKRVAVEIRADVVEFLDRPEKKEG